MEWFFFCLCLCQKNIKVRYPGLVWCCIWCVWQCVCLHDVLLLCAQTGNRANGSEELPRRHEFICSHSTYFTHSHTQTRSRTHTQTCQLISTCSGLKIFAHALPQYYSSLMSRWCTWSNQSVWLTSGWVGPWWLDLLVIREAVVGLSK